VLPCSLPPRPTTRLTEQDRWGRPYCSICHGGPIQRRATTYRVTRTMSVRFPADHLKVRSFICEPCYSAHKVDGSRHTASVCSVLFSFPSDCCVSFCCSVALPSPPSNEHFVGADHAAATAAYTASPMLVDEPAEAARTCEEQEANSRGGV
jgi:hypothetical protein